MVVYCRSSTLLPIFVIAFIPEIKKGRDIGNTALKVSSTTNLDITMPN